jgi:adenylate cyclase
VLSSPAMRLPAHLPRRLRLISGVVLFTYITTHLTNHALGIVSLRLAESALEIAFAFWRNPLVTIVLYGSAALHFSLALWTLYSRREWRLPLIEILRLAAGFSLPLILIRHVLATRVAEEMFGIEASYSTIIGDLRVTGLQGLQLALLAPGWVHGCLGLWITLRRSRAIRRLKPLLLAVLVLVPVFAAAGFFRMEAQVAALHVPPSARIAGGPESVALAAWKDTLIDSYLALILLAILLGRLRHLPQLRGTRSSA